MDNAVLSNKMHEYDKDIVKRALQVTAASPPGLPGFFLTLDYISFGGDDIICLTGVKPDGFRD